jgi:hypothetical protein
MRIAVAGTHVIGKSTLVAELGARLPGYRIVPEPYETLENRGYEFDHPPSVEDFVMQLRHSILTLGQPWPNAIFERCPLDFLGYIQASPGAERFNLERWRAPINSAMNSLDLVVVLHLDPRHDPGIVVEDSAFRLAVDEELHDIVDGDAFDLCDGVEILPLSGAWDRRADRVMSHIDIRRG